MWMCRTPTEGAKRRREERSLRWKCSTPTGGAKRRREERSLRWMCSTPTEGAKRRREERSYPSRVWYAAQPAPRLDEVACVRGHAAGVVAATIERGAQPEARRAGGNICCHAVR